MYQELIAIPSRQISFWMLVGFLPTFLVARLVVDTLPSLHLAVHGTHVHHFTYGIVMLSITGFVSLVWPRKLRTLVAVAYGSGLALAFDEFGTWLHLTSNYNLDQSEDTMVGILVFLAIIAYGVGIVQRAARAYRSHR